MPIRLISTDFDGTLFAEFEQPPVPPALERLLASLQRGGARWVINTGRELSSLLETLGRAQLQVQPDALVLVEREIYLHQDHQYVPLREWNDACNRAHDGLFARVAPGLTDLIRWLNDHADATIYEDPFSPLCVIAQTAREADRIQQRLDAFAREVPDLAVVRNDVYIRFCHSDYDKGRGLQELGRLWGVSAEETLAAGDHYNDLPMLRPEVARWLVAPANAIPEVRAAVQAAEGYLSRQPCGHGVASGIEYFLERAG